MCEVCAVILLENKPTVQITIEFPGVYACVCLSMLDLVIVHFFVMYIGFYGTVGFFVCKC